MLINMKELKSCVLGCVWMCVKCLQQKQVQVNLHRLHVQLPLGKRVEMLHQSRVGFIFVRSFFQFPCYFGSLYILKWCFVWVCWLSCKKSASYVVAIANGNNLLSYTLGIYWLRLLKESFVQIVFPHRNVIMLKSSVPFYMYGSNYPGTICEHPLFARCQLSN